MLSRQGFINLGSRDYLRDASQGFVYLGRTILQYGIWSKLGPIPRNLLPGSTTGDILRVEKHDKQEAEGDRALKPISGSEDLSTFQAAPETGIQVKGEEKKIGALLQGDEWEGSTTQKVTERPTEATRSEQKDESFLKVDKFDTSGVLGGKLATKLMKPTDDEITSQQEYGKENVELGGIAVEARIEKGEESNMRDQDLYKADP